MLVIGAEHVVADTLAALFEAVDDRLGTADQYQMVVNIEVQRSRRRVP
jgi:hypothetical protein